MSGTDMAGKFGVLRSVVNNYMRKNGLSVPHELQVAFRANAMKGRTTFTKAEDRFIKKHYLQFPIKALAEKMNRSFTGITGRLKAMNLQIPGEIIQQRKNIGRFKPGATPINKGKKQIEFMSAETIERTKKTRFKKGQLPHNTKKDGEIVIRHNHLDRNEKPYKWIRVKLGHWMMLQRYVWEQKHGKLPKGAIVRFKDGNTMNCSIRNLTLITQAKNMELNSIVRYPTEIRTSMHLLSKLNKKIDHAKK